MCSRPHKCLLHPICNPLPFHQLSTHLSLLLIF
ncbi:hypothetical protein KSS87_006941 [Heliosperma pusillum]|nr:hypothetical protein KSS87_006941 [Heliosperma pusillum]